MVALIVLIGQDTIAYSLSEDGQELTFYTDDTPTLIMTRIVYDMKVDVNYFIYKA